jgi:hypothetical protein
MPNMVVVVVEAEQVHYHFMVVVVVQYMVPEVEVLVVVGQQFITNQQMVVLMVHIREQLAVYPEQVQTHQHQDKREQVELDMVVVMVVEVVGHPTPQKGLQEEMEGFPVEVVVEVVRVLPQSQVLVSVEMVVEVK